MKFKLTEIPGSIVAPRGFRASGVFCDIKRLGTGKGSDKGKKRDLALIVSETPAAVAGMFTTNQVCAAPVKVCVERIKRGAAQALVVNSGNANACTGKQGMRDAIAMTDLVARELGISARKVFVGSTGRIGVAIQAKTLQAAMQEAVAQSFNRITVDGDMSTNDTVLVLANGLAGNSELVAADVRRLKSKNKVRVASPRSLQDFKTFQAALGYV